MILAIVIIIIIIYLTRNARNKYNSKNYSQNYNQHIPQQQSKEKNVNYIDRYKKTPILSNHEREAYNRIKEVTDIKGYTVFTKVRLLDLIEPQNAYRNDQSYLWKIQSKHVDFVICDEKIDAKWVIELQDKSHEREDRIERDNFVKAILTNCNYKILMTYTATDEEIKNFLEHPPKIIETE